MGESIIALISVLAFSLSFHFLLISLTENMRMKALVSGFSMKALRVERIYKIMSWSVLTALFFVSTVVTMYKIYNDLNPLF